MDNYITMSSIYTTSDQIERKNLYMDKLTKIYDAFKDSTKGWTNFTDARDRMATHHLTYNESDLEDIKVAYYKVMCYLNMINDNYIKNQYEKLGINNFFAELADIVGPVKIFTIEQIDTYKIEILDNTTKLIEAVEDLYKKFISYASTSPTEYIYRLDWFLKSTSMTQSIIFTVQYALKDYLYNRNSYIPSKSKEDNT